MCTHHVNTTPTLSITVYIMSILCLSFFSHFLAIFAPLTIFGNVHRPCKQCPNIVNNSLHHVCSFFLFFSDFLAIFMSITILGNAHRPCTQLSNITTPFLFFSSIFSYFFHQKLQNLPYLAIFSVHSSHWIPVPFRSSQFRGLFW